MKSLTSNLVRRLGHLVTGIAFAALLAACDSPATVKVPTAIPSSTPNQLIVPTATMEPDPTSTPVPAKRDADLVCSSVPSAPAAIGRNVSAYFSSGDFSCCESSWLRRGHVHHTMRSRSASATPASSSSQKSSMTT